MYSKMLCTWDCNALSEGQERLAMAQQIIVMRKLSRKRKSKWGCRNRKSKWGSGEDGNGHTDYCEEKAFGKAKVLSEGQDMKVKIRSYYSVTRKGKSKYYSVMTVKHSWTSCTWDCHALSLRMECWNVVARQTHAAMPKSLARSITLCWVRLGSGALWRPSLTDTGMR